MADTAAWLVDRVLPAVPYRQWVLSLPYRVQVLCAYDPAAAAAVAAIHTLERSRRGWERRNLRCRSPLRLLGAVARPAHVRAGGLRPVHAGSPVSSCGDRGFR